VIGDSSAVVYAERTGRDTTPVPILTSRFNEIAPSLSPDGKWLAYASDESGQQEVYVRPFPNTGQGRWQISIGGGSSPRWARSGRELFYQSGANQMMVAAVAVGPAFSAGQPHKLFEPSNQLFPSNVVPYYDLSPDDKRFLMVRLAGVSQAPGAGQLVVVENWFEELRQKVKAGQH
jgi:protease II